jgi:hypothetical protein
MLPGGLAYLDCLPVPRITVERLLCLITGVAKGAELEKGSGQQRRRVRLPVEGGGSG